MPSIIMVWRCMLLIYIHESECIHTLAAWYLSHWGVTVFPAKEE